MLRRGLFVELLVTKYKGHGLRHLFLLEVLLGVMSLELCLFEAKVIILELGELGVILGRVGLMGEDEASSHGEVVLVAVGRSIAVVVSMHYKYKLPHHVEEILKLFQSHRINRNNPKMNKSNQYQIDTFIRNSSAYIVFLTPSGRGLQNSSLKNFAR